MPTHFVPGIAKTEMLAEFESTCSDSVLHNFSRGKDDKARKVSCFRQTNLCNATRFTHRSTHVYIVSLKMQVTVCVKTQKLFCYERRRGGKKCLWARETEE